MTHWEAAIWQELEEMHLRAQGTDRRFPWGLLTEVYFAYGAQPPPANMVPLHFAFEALIQHVDVMSDLQRAMLVITICKRHERGRYQVHSPLRAFDTACILHAPTAPCGGNITAYSTYLLLNPSAFQMPLHAFHLLPVCFLHTSQSQPCCLAPKCAPKPAEVSHEVHSWKSFHR